MPNVRTATYEVLRRYSLTTLFANPGSTEVAFLADLPRDIDFVLGLHEGSVVGMATGWAIGRDRPALVNLHTVAGVGNAVGALATARQNRAPMVVIVGLQDRRHLAMEPFLSGDVAGLAGSYPVWVHTPGRAEDVPGAVARAYYEATLRRGPALVLVPMDDWETEFDEATVIAAPRTVRDATAVDVGAVHEVAERLRSARSPLLVTGAGADTAQGWAAMVSIAEATGAPVWQEALGARAGYPQDHPSFAGYLPPDRDGVRRALHGHDLVLVFGAPVFRQYPYRAGPLVPEDTCVVQITDEVGESSRAVADLSLLAPVGAFLTALAAELGTAGSPRRNATTTSREPAIAAQGGGSPVSGALHPAEVFAALAARLPPDTVLVEETPSSGPLLRSLVPARSSLGRLSAAGGGLGFAMPAAIGLRMATPGRPVVCVVGDGSSLYAMQSLWSAAHYAVGVLFVVLANGRYKIMDDLATQFAESSGPRWPGFGEIDVSRIATGFGCPARRVERIDELEGLLDRVVATLGTRGHPLLVEVAVR